MIELKRIGFFEDDWMRLLKVKYNIIAKKLNAEADQLFREEKEVLYIELMVLYYEINFYD